MRPEATHDDAVMTFRRCPACGRRVALAGTRAACAVHGLLEPSLGETRLRLDVGVPTAPPAPPAIAGYHVVQHLADGGFGSVWGAVAEAGGAPAVVKVARLGRAGADAYLRREIEVLRAVGAPHVPAVFAEGQLDNGMPWVAMERLDGVSLAEWLGSRAEPVPIPQAIALALAILRPLAAVHEKGVVHCDLKPENVFLDEQFDARLIDFGLAQPAPALERTITEGVPAGTADYMSPEQCEGASDLDARTDLYALAVMLFELVASRPPFWGASAMVRESHVSRRAPRLSVAAGRPVPPGLDELVDRCLAKDRRERPVDAAALRAALEAALQEAERFVPPSVVEKPAAAVAEAPGEEAPAAAKASRGGDRLTLGLVFFESEGEAAAVRAKIRILGGQLAHSSGMRHVAVFGVEVTDNAARRALIAAQEMLRDGVCERLRIDLAPVAVQARRDGSKRFLSPLFTQPQRYPRTADPPGISLAPAAASVLPDVEAAEVAVASSTTHIVSDSRPGSTATQRLRPAGGDPTAMPSSWPLVGRDAVVESLVAGAARAAAERRPTSVTVIADTGDGKSHLAREVASRLEQARTADVILMRAHEPALGDVDHTLAELLRRLLDLPSVVPPDGGMELLRRRLGPAGEGEAPLLAMALGWATSDTTSTRSRVDTGLRAMGAAPGALRSALAIATGEVLRRRAAARPLQLLLDDAHFASDLLRAACESATLADEACPIWICVLARPRFEEIHPGWGERAGHHEKLRLPPLVAEDAAALCRQLLRPVDDPPDDAVRRLVERTQGNPLLLVELVRGLRRQGAGRGIVRRRPGAEGFYLATDELDRLPDLPLIEWLARAEIEGLSPALQGHARLLALLGERVTLDEIRWVLRRLEEDHENLVEFPLDARIGTQRLLSSGILVEEPDGTLRYRHVLVREAVVRATPEAQRRRIHEAAVAYYQHAEDEHGLAQLGWHASAVGKTTLAERAWLELADRAAARHAYTDAERLYSRVLELPETNEPGDATSAPLRERALRGRGLMRYRIGRHHDALEDFAAARRAAATRGDAAIEAEILLDEATALDWMDQFKLSEERVQQAEALLARIDVPLLRARLLLGQGRTLQRFCRGEESVQRLEASIALADTLGDAGYETVVISWVILGFLYQGLGRIPDARRAVERTLELAQHHGDALHRSVALGVRGLLCALTGDKDAMIADMESSIRLARQLGQTQMELINEFNLGEYLYLMDDVAAASPHVARALDVDRRLSGDPGRAVVHILDARVRYYQGDEAGAAAIVARIRERQAEALAAGQPDPLMVPSEDVMCRAIELALQGGSPEEWEALATRSARDSVGQEQIEVLELGSIAAARRGEATEAASRRARAIELLPKIPNVMQARLMRRRAAS